MGRLLAIALLGCVALLARGQNGNDSHDFRVYVRQGNAALADNKLREAARAFQRALDLNPSSAKAHEGLGVTLFREINAGNVRPSADTDVADRAELHLKQAAELSPSSPAPLTQLAELEALLAERSPDSQQRTERYQKAQDALKQVISLNPSKPETYLQLANLERDEFGPAIQQAKARFAKTAGPISDANVRAALQRQYGALVDDAIRNAQQASNMNASAQRPLLLLARLFRERAVIRDTPDQYSADMHKAADWQRQFLAVGGHLEQ